MKTPFEVLQLEGSPLAGYELAEEITEDQNTSSKLGVLLYRVSVPGDRFSYRIRVFEASASNDYQNMYIDCDLMRGRETIPVDNVYRNHNGLNDGILEKVNEINAFLKEHDVEPDWWND